MLVFSAWTPSSADPRVQTEEYLGGWAGPNFPCDGVAGQGGACFYASPGDETFTFRVSDDNVTFPIGGWYAFRHAVPSFEPQVLYPFCGGEAAGEVEPPRVPFDIVEVVVALDLGYAVSYCETPGVPTTGTITIELS